MERIKLHQLNKISYACPSQWIGITTNNKRIYIRYRWGILTVRKSLTNRNCIYKEVVGDELDGHLNTVNMIHHTKDVLDYSDCVISEITED